MTILIYSDKKVVSQLLVQYIEGHFKNIDYSSDISVKQINELSALESLIEEENGEYLLITDLDYREIVLLDSISYKKPILLITNTNEQRYVRETYQNIFICDSIYKLESYMDDFLKRIPANHSIEALTKREKEILKLIAKGLLNKEIANELNITERTVKNHISNIFKKINVYDRTQAAVFAIKNKIFLL